VLRELLDAESSSVGSEYFINSAELQDKVRTLLPSQGGAGAGFDLSASTQIIPIIDLTESAEGSNLREDLQTSLSLNSVTTFFIENTTTTLISNTGYYRVFGNFVSRGTSGVTNGKLQVTDGTTTKALVNFRANSTSTDNIIQLFDFIVFLNAGDSLEGLSSNANSTLSGVTRQIADINGSLIDPT